MKIRLKNLIFAVLLVVSTHTFADTITWDSGNGNWNDASKWDNGVPAANDDVVIDNSATNSSVNMNVNATVRSLTITGGDRLSVANARTLRVNDGPVNNNGTILLNSTGSLTDMQVAGNVTFNGNGELRLGAGPSTSDDRNRIFGTTNAQRVTNSGNHTISGGGQLGANQMRLTNHGTIIANDTNDSLTIDLSGSDNFNSGTIQATSGGTLTINPSVINNSNGLVRASNGNININSSTIQNGEIVNDGGTITLNSSTVNTGANIDINNGNLNVNSSTIQDSITNTAAGTTVNLNNSNINSGRFNNSGRTNVTVSSTLRNGNLNNQGQFVVNNAQTLRLENGVFNNDGSILLNSTGSLTDMQVTGAVTLTGNGELRLGAGPSTSDDRNRVFGSTNAQRLINDNNHTVSGGGQLGANQMRLTNRGTITANDTNDSLTIDLSGSDNFNSGTIQATSGGTLTINPSVINNSNGLVRANNGNININSSTIQNGEIVNDGGTITLNSSTVNTGANIDINSGNLNVNSSTIQDSTTNIAAGTTANLNNSNVNSGTFNNSGRTNVTVSSTLRNGNLNNQGQFVVNNAQTLRLENGVFNNDGTILLNSTGSLTDMQVTGTVTLTGDGELKLGAGPSTSDDRNRIFGSTNAQRLVNDTNHTISGGGQLGANQMRLTNRGTISANDTNDSLTIDLSGSDNFNSGTIQAVSKGTLTINPSVIDNDGGLVQANDGNININSSTIRDGVIAANNNGNITLNSSTINSGANININSGNLNVNSSTIQDSTTNIANGSRANLNNSSVNSGAFNNNGTTNVTASSALRNGNLNNQGQFTVNNAQTLTLENGEFNNDGTILLNSTGSLTDMQVVGTVTLTGDGELKLGAGPSTSDDRNRIFGSTNAQRLINDTNHTISGGGQLGANQMRLTNRGTITANDTNDSLAIDLSGSDNFNNGLIQSQAGATLTINPSVIDNSGGLIRANNGSININSSTITGGNQQVNGPAGRITLNSTTINGASRLAVNDGVLQANSSTINGSLVEVAEEGRFNVNSSVVNGTNNGGKIKNQGVVEVSGSSTFRNSSLKNDGSVVVRNASTLTLDNGVFQNNGTILLNSTGSLTDMRITNTVNLTGTGTLKLGAGPSTSDDRNRIFGSTNSQRLIQGANHTIEGGGQLGANQMRLTNRGDIVGNDTNDTLRIDLSGSDNFNGGNIRSTSGGSVLITGSVITNNENGTKGTIAANGGTTTISSSTISGGGNLIVTQGGNLSIASSTISVDSIAMDNSRISIANSNVSLAEGFSYATTNSGNFNLNTANVTLTGGSGAAVGDWGNWSYLEVGGRDLNNDGDNIPSARQLASNSAGFTNNFDMRQLTIGAGSQVFLMDAFNNQAGLEALYVDTLILGAGSTLYLNGANVYFANLINQGGTIITDDLGRAILPDLSIPDLTDNPTVDPVLPPDPFVEQPLDPEAPPVPEPATWLTMLIALSCITFFRLRNKN